MSESFEETWNEAELLNDEELASSISTIREIISDIESTGQIENDSELSQQFGKLLFALAQISKKMNVNVAAALKLANDDVKVDKYG